MEEWATPTGNETGAVTADPAEAERAKTPGQSPAEADGNRTRLPTLAGTPVLKTVGPTRRPDASGASIARGLCGYACGARSVPGRKGDAMARMARHAALIGSLAALALGFAACGDDNEGGGGATTGGGGGTTVAVTLQEYAVLPDSDSAPAGGITFD